VVHLSVTAHHLRRSLADRPHTIQPGLPARLDDHDHMRPLRRDLRQPARVQRLLRELDHRVSHPLRIRPLIIWAGLSGFGPILLI